MLCPMSHLSHHINSAYIAAANRLRGKEARRKVVAYVESYDDILFWKDVLSEVETDKVEFEVLLPSQTSLGRGKKIALSNRLGHSMIACVDADYDFLMQGATPTSEMVCFSPYVLHTGVYAIENLQCHAETLAHVCVMATLNDQEVMDYEAFFAEFSEIIFPLLVWNVWAYRYGRYTQFSLSDFARVVELRFVNIYHPEEMLQALKRRVNQQINRLQRMFPEGRQTYAPLRKQLLQLGVTPQTAYLYMRGHDLLDGVVMPLMTSICDMLRRQREREISKLACHAVQKRNELAAYQHAIAPFEAMVRKQTAYHHTEAFARIVDAARMLMTRCEEAAQCPEESEETNIPAIPTEEIPQPKHYDAQQQLMMRSNISSKRKPPKVKPYGKL